uniref:Putative secreted protein n=1 Tax=Anopheles triannulatus TaxID=58253 RepID=A0A2M4B5B2_9DIPT
MLRFSSVFAMRWNVAMVQAGWLCLRGWLLAFHEKRSYHRSATFPWNCACVCSHTPCPRPASRPFSASFLEVPMAASQQHQHATATVPVFRQRHGSLLHDVLMMIVDCFRHFWLCFFSVSFRRFLFGKRPFWFPAKMRHLFCCFPFFPRSFHPSRFVIPHTVIIAFSRSR